MHCTFNKSWVGPWIVKNDNIIPANPEPAVKTCMMRGKDKRDELSLQCALPLLCLVMFTLPVRSPERSLENGVKMWNLRKLF